MKNSKLFIKLSCILPALLMLCMVNLKAQDDLIGYTFVGTMWTNEPSYTAHYYYISNCETTWEEANAAANEMGGYLATISTFEENEFLAQWVQNHFDYNDELAGAWIGLRGENGIYEWSNGEPIGWINWGYNPHPVLEPIYADGATLIGSIWNDYDFSWFSYPVTGEAEYIVEFPFQPNCNNNPNKAFVCHNGNTICVSISSLQAHLDHGDLEGPCGPCNSNAMQTLPNESLATDGHSHQTPKAILSEPKEELDNVQAIRPSNQIHIFPNPASDIIQVHIPGMKEQGMLLIQDQFGRTVWSEKIEEGQKFATINLDDKYSVSGIYFLSCVSNGEVHTRRMVISK